MSKVFSVPRSVRLLDRYDLLKSNTKLCFDDILLEPCYSEISSRTAPTLNSPISQFLSLECPIVTAPMDSITGWKMATVMDECGGLGIISRNIQNPEAVLTEVSGAFSNGAEWVGCAVGIKDIDLVKTLLDVEVNVICVDVQHADHAGVHKFVQEIAPIKNKYSAALVVGNVCTLDAAMRLADCGADCIKVGIGPGAACSTRNVTGFGVPQLSAIIDCARIKETHENVTVIADGGLRTTGDMIKALWAGADLCMIGWMVSASSDCPDIGRTQYRGMSSREVSGREDIAPEGVVIDMPNKGDTKMLIEEYKKGLRAGLAMCGASNIEELRTRAGANIVSPLSMKETGTC